MAASQVSTHQPLYYQAHRWIYKHVQSGTYLFPTQVAYPSAILIGYGSIYRPSKTATQSGDWHSHHWRMDWDVLAKGNRWENPLMGWQSSADFMQGTKLNFKTKEDAIMFANKQGYEYFVQEPNERKIVPKAYADQFVHSSKTLKQVRTK